MVNYRPAYLGVGFGKRVRDLREKHGLTQNALAQAAHVPQPTLNRVENNPAKDPALSVAVKIARALGVPVEYLYDDRHSSRSHSVSHLKPPTDPDVTTALDSLATAVAETLDALSIVESLPAPVRGRLRRIRTQLGSGGEQ